MKDIELKLACELMKNSRRSDRELARAIGVSQSTVSRMIKRLEREGVIKEYTMIPDLAKLGYGLLGLTFVKLKKMLNPSETDKAREIAKQEVKEGPFGIIMLERGMGKGYDGVITAYYKDYTEYLDHHQVLREYPFLDFDVEGFLIDLNDKIRYRPLSLQKLAEHLLATREKRKWAGFHS